MMIETVAWLPFRLPFSAPFATAHGPAADREGLLLRLSLAGGLTGLGEATPTPAFGGGDLPAALGALAGLAPRLPGRSLAAAEGLLADLDHARPGVTAVAAALDCALCDLRAQQAGVALAQWLGGDPARAVPVNATVGAPAPATAAAAARHAVQSGFGCVKLKVGAAGSIEAELDRIAAVRAAMGPDPCLRLDANGAWDSTTAIALIRAAERYTLELVEQPVAPADLSGMARVRAAVDTPIAADEPVGRLEQARRVVAAAAAAVLVVKPMLAGGLRPARQIIALAQQAGLRVIVTNTIDAGVGTAAALHLAATLPAPPLACGLATGSLLAADLITPSLAVEAGTMRVPPGPGLGVTLDAAQLARYGTGWQSVGGEQ